MPDRDLQPFTHVTVPNAALYRRVMAAFAQAKRRFTVHLRPEDILAAAAGSQGAERDAAVLDLSSVTDALTKLVEWGNLRADPDTSRVTSVEDFHRARFLYQLTPEGEAAEQALVGYDEALGRRGALHAVALADIVTQLQALRALARSADLDPAKVHLILLGLVDRFTHLADNAQAFMSSLQRSIDLHDADVDAFRAYKDHLIDYLERFIKDLVTRGAEIANLVIAIEDGGADRLLAVAARREAADAAPGSGNGDEDDPREVAFVADYRLWQERWLGLRQWFLSESNHPSQAKLLRARARAAIPQLLQVVSSLNERRAGRSDRSTDFRELARWFAQAPDDAAMHRLWRVSFGLAPARHLTVDSTTLAERSENSVSSATPWAGAPPLRISPQLRKTGSYERRGKPNRVIDRGEARRYLADLAQKQAAETAEARVRLATTRPTRLKDVGELDPVTFGLFLQLLGDALAARRPGVNTVVTTTADGTMQIRLGALEDVEMAEIHTPNGVFRGPDHLVEIIDLTAPADLEVRSA